VYLRRWKYFDFFRYIYKMDGIDKETARYIIIYFSSLMTGVERLALRHSQSTFKLEDVENEKLTKAYYKNGWLSTDPEVLKLLKDGDDQFMINCAERILKENGDGVFLNYCPNCGRLARTPQAKQCRFCAFDWH
jgi:hypothetical protein